MQFSRTWVRGLVLRVRVRSVRVWNVRVTSGACKYFLVLGSFVVPFVLPLTRKGCSFPLKGWCWSLRGPIFMRIFFLSDLIAIWKADQMRQFDKETTYLWEKICKGENTVSAKALMSIRKPHGHDDQIQRAVLLSLSHKKERIWSGMILTRASFRLWTWLQVTFLKLIFKREEDAWISKTALAMFFLFFFAALSK